MGDTGSTTRPELTHRSAPFLVAVLAICLLVLAWPRLHAAWLYLPVESAIRSYWNDQTIPADRLADLQSRARQAIAVHAHPRYWEGLSLLHYLEALAPGITLNEQRLAFEGAISASEASLRLAPVQPRLWMRTADTLNWLAFRPDPALSAFKMSVLTGRVEPMLQMSRLRLGYSRLGALDEEGRDLLRDQTMLAWQMRKRDVLLALRRGDLQLIRLRHLLESTHPDLLAEIEQALAPAP